MKKLLPILVILPLAASSWAWTGKMQFKKDGSEGIAVLESDSNTLCLSTIGQVEIVDHYYSTNSSMCVTSSIQLNDLYLTPRQTREEAIEMMEDNDFELISG